MDNLTSEFIETFSIDPRAFMDKCLDHFERENEFHPFCRYVQLALNQKFNNLNTTEINIKNELKEKFGEINIDHFDFFNKILEPPTIGSIYRELQEIGSDAYLAIQKAHEKSPNAGYAGVLEFTKALRDNMTFARNDIKNKGAKFRIESNEELWNCLINFRGYVYKVNSAISVKLKPKAFVHILLGHVKPFLMPRKGKLVEFSIVHTGDELLFLIERIIISLKSELILHYSSNGKKFSKEIYIENLKYGIHISPKGEILTLYQIK